MRGRASRHRDASLSLFPFLAVLICTVGALIVLLVVVVQQSRVHAALVESAPAKQDELARQELVRQRQSYLQRIRALEQSHEHRSQHLAAQRQQLSGLQDNARQLASHVAELDQTARKLHEQLGASTRGISTSQHQLQEVTRQIDDQNKQQKDEADDPDRQQRSYALIPYSGPSETHRRPIYLECFSDRVVLEPEGIVFHDQDFAGPLGPNNPLAAALRAARAYLKRAPGTSQQPYPLLVVRPEGAEAYAAARAAMRSWESQFGYELVPEDVKLAYPAPDPELAELLRLSIQTARAHQQRTQLALGISGRQNVASGVWAPSRRGGFARVPSGSESRGGFGQSDPTRELFGQPEPPAGGQRGVAGPFGQQSARPGDHNRHTAQAAQPSAAAPSAAGQRYAPQGTDYAGRLSGNARGNALRSGDRFRAHEAPRAVADGSEPTPESGGASSGGAGTRSAERAARSRRPVPASGQASTPEGSSGSGKSGPSPSGGQFTSQGSGPRASAGNSAAPPQGPGMFQGGLSSSLAETRGADWALPDISEGSLGITRPIAVTCQRNRILMGAEPGSVARAQSIPIRGATQSAIDPLVSAIWMRIESWGIAGPGVYWKPELHIAVAPEAEFRFRELRALMQESGIPIVRKTR